MKDDDKENENKLINMEDENNNEEESEENEDDNIIIESSSSNILKKNLKNKYDNEFKYLINGDVYYDNLIKSKKKPKKKNTLKLKNMLDDLEI